MDQHSRPMSLGQQFHHLETSVETLIDLLESAEERYWVSQLNRGLIRVQARQLAGATFVLGCYGGEGTLSDLMIGRGLAASEPARFTQLNAELTAIRTTVFESASTIASRRIW